jgi:hypothetical protein
LISSSTATRLAAIPMQIDHWEKLSSTVPKIRSSSPIVVTAMIARRAIPIAAQLRRSSSLDGCLNERTLTPCGVTPDMTCSIVESLPAASSAWNTTSSA